MYAMQYGRAIIEGGVLIILHLLKTVSEDKAIRKPLRDS